MKNLKGPGDIFVRAFRLSSMMPLRNTYISTKQSYLCTNKSVNSHNPHISMNKINNDINTKFLFWHKKRLKCLTFNQHWVIIYIQPILGINILLYEIDLSCFTEKPVYRNDWMPFNTAWLNLFCLRRLQTWHWSCYYYYISGINLFINWNTRRKTTHTLLTETKMKLFTQ